MPRFSYDIAHISDRYRELAQSLPVGAALFYSVKANSNLSVLQSMSRLGLSAEISSVGELKRIIEAGFDPTQAIYGGPGKIRRDLDVAIALGVRRFSLESPHELALLDAVTPEHSRDLIRILRILVPSARPGLNMMTPHSKFGMTLQEVREYLSCGGVVDGVHLYYGTQQPFTDFVHSISTTNQIVRQVEEIIQRELSYINYGGGLEWPFMRRGAAKVPAHVHLDVLSRKNICFEFGRYLVASSGTLETTVLDSKVRDGYQVLIVDAGVQTIGGLAAGGKLLRANVDFNWNETTDSSDVMNTAVYGPLCTSADYLSLGSKLPCLGVGAKLQIPNCGAYGANTGLVDFLIRDRAEEVVH